MSRLSSTFIDKCPREQGFIIRGQSMTRVETFVDAAFAFALTMLIISLDEMPDSMAALTNAAKGIPAFVASGLQIGLIWHHHSRWSRRFGLEDTTTVILSLALVMLILIFIYPLKLVFLGLFAWLSNGYLSSGLTSMTVTELSNLFVFFAAGFICLSLIFVFFYRNTLRHAKYLRLTAYERYQCWTEIGAWLMLAAVALVSGILAKTLPGIWIVIAGFIYGILGVTDWLWYRYRKRSLPTVD